MSYILEALKRAERERHLGKAPTVETLAQSAPPPPSRRQLPRGFWLAAASLLILAAALLLLFWPRPPAEAPHIPQPVAAAAPAPAVPVAPPRPEPAPATAAEPPALEDSAAVGSLDDVTAPRDYPGKPAVPGPAAAAPLQTEDVAQTLPQSAPVAADETIATVEATPAATPSATGARPLREMPDSFRAQFPVRGIDVHVYEPEPARRWIMIGDKRYREGDSVDGGARIAGIVDNGVIFEFSGQQVLWPVR